MDLYASALDETLNGLSAYSSNKQCRDRSSSAVRVHVKTSMAHKPVNESVLPFPGGRVLEDTYAPSERQEKHAHAHTNVSIVLGGSLEESVCGKVEHAFPLSVVVKPRDTEHRDVFGTRGARMLSVILTPEFTESLKDWAPSLNCWRWTHGGSSSRGMLRLLKTYRRCSALPDGELENCVYETLASFPYTESSGANTPAPRWLELIRQELDDRLAETVRVRDLAARAKVHPVYLARRFRRYLGCSITDYRTRLRTRAAAEILISSNASIASAANHCGFADQSHLCRAFKAATGLTPRDYRRLTNGS
jgi:AraC family transcriptional regulator